MSDISGSKKPKEPIFQEMHGIVPEQYSKYDENDERKWTMNEGAKSEYHVFQNPYKSKLERGTESDGKNTSGTKKSKIFEPQDLRKYDVDLDIPQKKQISMQPPQSKSAYYMSPGQGRPQENQGRQDPKM